MTGPERPPEVSPDMLVSPVSLEKGMSWLPWVSLALIAANLAAFAYQLPQLKPRGDEALRTQALLAMGAGNGPAIASGEAWRLVSSTFLHASLGHLVGNMLGLYLFGVLCEHLFGRRFTFAAYVWAGVGGSLASAVRPAVSVGASGAVFGLAGLLGAALYARRHYLHAEEKRIGLVLLGWGALTIFEGLRSPYIDNLGHTGGFLVGLLFGKYAVPRPIAEEAQPSSGTLYALALSAAVVLAVAAPRTLSALIP